MRRSMKNLVLASAALLSLASCSGSGNHVGPALIPSSYSSVLFDLPSWPYQIIGIGNDGTVYIGKDNLILKWDEVNGLQTVATGPNPFSLFTFDSSGLIGCTDDHLLTYVVSGAGVSSIRDGSGIVVAGLVLGFIDSKPSVAIDAANVMLPDKSFITLASKPGSPVLGPSAQRLSADGTIWGKVLFGNGPDSPSLWNNQGKLTLLTTPGTDVVTSEIKGVFNDSTAVGYLSGSTSKTMVQWDNRGQIQNSIVADSSQELTISGTTSAGFVVGTKSFVNGFGFVWTQTSGVKSITDMATLPSNLEPGPLLPSCVNDNGWIVGIGSVSDGHGGAIPKGILLKPNP